MSTFLVCQLRPGDFTLQVPMRSKQAFDLEPEARLAALLFHASRGSARRLTPGRHGLHEKPR
ncbi:hypothetical protein TSMEX_008816 [Taenia solium]|eukprot:TsM_001113800 transcript=TsM_001113800 gene=TsM_001113800